MIIALLLRNLDLVASFSLFHYNMFRFDVGMFYFACFVDLYGFNAYFMNPVHPFMQTAA